MYNLTMIFFEKKLCFVDMLGFHHKIYIGSERFVAFFLFFEEEEEEENLID